MKYEFAWLLAVTLGAQTNSLERAWAEAAKGHRTQAIELARAVADKEPHNAEARFLLGSLLMEAGDPGHAVDELTQGVRLKPDAADGWNALGEAYNAFGRGGEARAPFEKAVQLRPEFGIAQANLGAVLLQAGDTAAAADHLDRAIRLLGNSPEAADALFARAKIFSTMGQTAEAAQRLELAVKQRPGFAAAWSDLGEARRVSLDSVGALSAFERAVALDPKDPIAHYRLGAELLRQDQSARALDQLEAAYRLAPQDQSTLNALQSAYRANDRQADAARIKQELAAVLKARDLKSQNGLQALKLNNQGADLEKRGDLAGAAALYQQALSLQPEHNGIRVNYAVALLRLGRWEQGLDELHQAAENDPLNTQIQTALRDALAQVPAALRPQWAKTLH